MIAAAAGLALAALLVWWGIGRLLPLLERRQVVDHPNERSSHKTAKPRGAGLVVLAVLLPAWAIVALLIPAPALGLAAGPGFWVLLAGAVALGAVSWLDDLRGLPPLPRFLAQVAAVAAVLWFWPAELLVFQGLLPAGLDRLAAGVLWLWFVNLYNFMDGIDGITAVETAALGLGLFLAAVAAGWSWGAALLPLLCAAAMAGFLPWNWEPSKIFLGDVGSVSLGYLLGWLLLLTAAQGQWAAALILPAYYLADATWTLGRRTLRGTRFWQPHREHLYQRAVRGGRSHAAVSGAILAGNLGLIAAAVLAAAGRPAWALALACLPLGLVIRHLARAAGK